MAKRNVLRELEQEHGNLERIILPLVNRGGQKLAAEKLNTSQNTISRWLVNNHYISRTIWQKDTTEEEKADILGAHERVNVARVAEGRPTLEEEEEFS